MSEPDPKIVRKVARTAMEMAATRRDDLDVAIRRHGGLGDMPEEPEAKAEYRKAYGALYRSAAADMKAGATVTVSWPDEQDDDARAASADLEQLRAERVTDTAAVRALLSSLGQARRSPRLAEAIHELRAQFALRMLEQIDITSQPDCGRQGKP